MRTVIETPTFFNLSAEGVVYLIMIYKKSERENIKPDDIKRATP